MILLDTDHVTVLGYPSNPRCASLQRRMESSVDRKIVISIVTVEENLRGWLAEIHRQRDFDQQLVAYDRLQWLLDFFSSWTIIPFTRHVAEECALLKKQRIRIGAMDLKIAAIARTHDALLLSANLRDFGRVPGLRVESWLD